MAGELVQDEDGVAFDVEISVLSVHSDRTLRTNRSL
jgi:hypothetical protein